MMMMMSRWRDRVVCVRQLVRFSVICGSEDIQPMQYVKRKRLIMR